jgi:hypothetical protein
LPRHKSFPRPSKVTVEYLPVIVADANKSYDEIAEQVKMAIAKN